MPRMYNYGIPEEFPEGYGKQINLLKKFGLDEESILNTIIKMD